MPVIMQLRATHEKEKNEIGFDKNSFSFDKRTIFLFFLENLSNSLRFGLLSASAVERWPQARPQRGPSESEPRNIATAVGRGAQIKYLST